MKQCWELQGKVRTEDSVGWITLKTNRSRKALRLNVVRRNAKRLGIQADYRAVLVNN